MGMKERVSIGNRVRRLLGQNGNWLKALLLLGAVLLTVVMIVGSYSDPVRPSTFRLLSVAPMFCLYALRLLFPDWECFYNDKLPEMEMLMICFGCFPTLMLDQNRVTVLNNAMRGWTVIGIVLLMLPYVIRCRSTRRNIVRLAIVAVCFGFFVAGTLRLVNYEFDDSGFHSAVATVTEKNAKLPREETCWVNLAIEGAEYSSYNVDRKTYRALEVGSSIPVRIYSGALGFEYAIIDW